MGFSAIKADVYSLGGAASSGIIGRTVNFGTENTLATINGIGLFYYYHMLVPATADSHKIEPIVRVDEEILHPHYTIEDFGNWGVGASSYPVQLYTKTNNGLCVMAWAFPKGIAFNESIRLSASNNSVANNVGVLGSYIISKYL